MRYVPGPGSYTPKVDIGDKTVLSVYHSANKKSFYHHDRFPKTNHSPNRNIPGPGTYATLTDFNLYSQATENRINTNRNSTFSANNSQFNQTMSLQNLSWKGVKSQSVI